MQSPHWLKPLSLFNVTVSRWAVNLAALLLAAMVIIILSQVFFRYVLNDSLSWSEELAKFMMVWVACLVAPWAYRENLNVAIHMFADAFPARLRLFTEWVISVLVILICGLFLKESIAFWQGGFSIDAASLPLKLGYFYSCAPVAFFLLICVGVEKLILQTLALAGFAQAEMSGDA